MKQVEKKPSFKVNFKKADFIQPISESIKNGLPKAFSVSANIHSHFEDSQSFP